MKRARTARLSLVVALSILTVTLGSASAILGVCGPFTDVAADAFCPFLLEIFYLGITTGTSPTTYEPTSNVSRLQMAALLSRTVDRTLQRGSPRAALGQFWTSQNSTVLGLTTLGGHPLLVKSDGADVWVADGYSVSRVRGSDGRLLETWTGATSSYAVLSAMGKILVTGATGPGKLYQIDPSESAGAVTTVATDLGNSPVGITFDGSRIWTSNHGFPFGLDSISIVTPGATIPWTVTTVRPTGIAFPNGILFDGLNIWVTDGLGLKRLDSNGAVLQTVTLSGSGQFPVFDGANIWVAKGGGPPSVSVVRASSGGVLATLTGNGLNGPAGAAFDGQRILITNSAFGANSVSLWKAADLSPLGSFPTGPSTGPFGACSDGVNFWITLQTPGQLARF